MYATHLSKSITMGRPMPFSTSRLIAVATSGWMAPLTFVESVEVRGSICAADLACVLRPGMFRNELADLQRFANPQPIASRRALTRTPGSIGRPPATLLEGRGLGVLGGPFGRSEGCDDVL